MMIRAYREIVRDIASRPESEEAVAKLAGMHLSTLRIFSHPEANVDMASVCRIVDAWVSYKTQEVPYFRGSWLGNLAEVFTIQYRHMLNGLKADDGIKRMVAKQACVQESFLDEVLERENCNLIAGDLLLDAYSQVITEQTVAKFVGDESEREAWKEVWGEDVEETAASKQPTAGGAQ